MTGEFEFPIDHDVPFEDGADPSNDADPLWVSKDGRKIRLSQMGDEHIRNCAPFCRRQAAAAMRTAGQALSYAAGAPDGAAMAAESEADALTSQAGGLLLWARRFEKEMEKRGIAHKPKRPEPFNPHEDDGA